MKKMMKSWALVAVAAMGLTACQNDFEEQIEAKDSVVVTFVADSADTRTSVDTSGDKPVFAWSENETFAVLEQTDALAAATSVTFTKEDGKAKIAAEFALNDGKDTYSYATIYPAAGYVNGESLEAVTLSLPAVQTMGEGSYDPTADLMVSQIVTTNAQPSEIQPLRFTRLASVVKMSLKNFGVELGDEVKSVTFTAEGKTLAGTVTANLTKVHEEGAVVVAEGSSSVTVNTTSASDIYFTLLPTTLEAGDAYTITVVTNNRLYIKQGTVPAEKSLVFEAGKVTRLGVDMQGVKNYEKWTLVTDASTLKSGDVVTIVAKNYNYVIGKQGSNYPYASYTEIVKGDTYFYHPVAIDATADHTMQRYTLVARDGGFDFYNGVDYEGDTYKGFAWANGTNNAPKLQAYNNNDTWFSVKITDGVATIKAEKIEKSYKWWRYYHSTYSSSRKFDMTSSEPTGNYQICLYRLEGAVGTIPTVAANVTVPTASVVIAEEGAAEATAIEAVVFNYVGDWTITATPEAYWLTVNYADEKLTYTAEQNTGAKREATVTITATREGEEALTWSFKVLQKGAPQDISIEEFVKLAKDENSTYRLTGKVVTVATNATTSGYYLADEKGNQAIIKYLDTEDGKDVWGCDDFTLKLGDIVTVTTVPMGSKSGGSSANPSIYKGHYGIEATAGLAADYTGGEVTIEVNAYSNGNVVAPTEIVGTMAENDFAEFSYSGGNSATVTFTSENTTSYAREAEVTFTCGLASATVVAQQSINPANKLGYELVTDASTLAVGDEVIIVALGVDKALGGLTSSTSATGLSNFPSVDIVKSGNVIYDAVEAGAIPFTLASVGTDGKFAFNFTHNSTGYNLYVSSSKLKGDTSTSSSYIKLSVSIDATSGAAEIKCSASTPYFVSYNSTSGKFGKASSADGTIAIYRMQK